MHEPLPRDWRLRYRPNATLALARACAFVVILAVVAVGLTVIIGELIVGRSDQAIATARLTIGSASGARDAAPSSYDLFTGAQFP